MESTTIIRKQWDITTIDFNKSSASKFGINNQSIAGAIRLLKDFNLRPPGSIDDDFSFKDLQGLVYLLTQNKYDTTDFTAAITKAIAELKVNPVSVISHPIAAPIASIVQSVLDFKLTIKPVSWVFNNKWILVAGTGRYNISQKLLLATEALGRMLADKGYGVVTGGWPGVDHVLSRAYTETLKRINISEKDYLIQVIIQNKKSDYEYGTIEKVKNDTVWYNYVLDKCCAVILLGGEGGTAEAYERAKEKNIPVIPLPATSGDAKMIYDKLISQVNYLVQSKKLQTLDAPLTSVETANTMALHVEDILKDINNKSTVISETEKPVLSEAAFKSIVEKLYENKKITVPEDLQKNRWGGKREQNGKWLKAAVVNNYRGSYDVTFVIEWFNKATASGQVAFFLHNSFTPEIEYAAVVKGKAQITVSAIEDFTIGAYTEDGTLLELDLSDVPDLPKAFYRKKIEKSFKERVAELYQQHPVVTPSDTQKNRWGNLSIRNGKQLTAQVKKSLLPSFYNLTININSETLKQQLKGDVAFFLHKTFFNEIRYKKAVDGIAKITIQAYEDFAIGAYTEDGTMLELDLSEVRGFPVGFYAKKKTTKKKK